MSEFDIVAALEQQTAILADLRDRQPRAAYRVPAAAARLDISEAHLRRLIADGRVVTVPHMGDVVLIAHTEIDRVVNARRAS